MKTHSAPPQAPTVLPFETGEPRSFGGLTVIPLFPAAEPRLEYVGLDEAAARGLVVGEVGEEGVVELLAVANPLAEHVLLYEGEELVGAKQNRILQWTALVPPKSKLSMPASCVEARRWSRSTPTFAPAPRAAHPSLRKTRHSGGGQQEVWAEIAAKSARLDAASPTGAQEAMYVSKRASIEEYGAALPRLDGQSGSLVAVAGVPVCLDWVSRPDVFAGLHGKLLQGYALEAVETPLEKPLDGAAVESFLAALRWRQGRMQETVGVGAMTRFAGTAVGSDLVAHGEPVALTAHRS
jgi:hypothetical protein